MNVDPATARFSRGPTCCSSTARLQQSFLRTRTFATSSVSCRNKAIVYRKHGNPSEVLSVLSFPDLPPPPPNTCQRPLSDAPVYVGGNEGLAEVVQVGDGVKELRKGDWVVMTKPQIGTWTSARNVGVQDAQAATLTSDVHKVNPPTAYNMGDWVVQNGANSAEYLKDLGATQVATYDQLAGQGIQGPSIRLGLNCIGGRATTMMVRLLGQDAHLVSYGAMSKRTANLTCHGFWQSQWYSRKSMQERERLMENLVGLMRHGKVRSHGLRQRRELKLCTISSVAQNTKY
ncbi:hypothetical protein BKA83DRAFT_97112 [Pisolithus microcarpus]|nr:hypothetical protein BKA83DRAFT_97112 [Pisolithus microcarpus]